MCACQSLDHDQTPELRQRLWLAHEQQPWLVRGEGEEAAGNWEQEVESWKLTADK